VPVVDRRLSSKAWRDLRFYVLDRDRWVCQVKGQGCTKAATCVDHIIPRDEGDERTFWDPANLRASCWHCNSAAGTALTNNKRKRYTYRKSVAHYVSRF